MKDNPIFVRIEMPAVVRQRIKASFDRLDTNKDHMVSRDEMNSVITAKWRRDVANGSTQELQPLIDGSNKQFENFDTNKNGLDLTEYEAMVGEEFMLKYLKELGLKVDNHPECEKEPKSPSEAENGDGNKYVPAGNTKPQIPHYKPKHI